MAVLDPNAIARNADYALDQVRRLGMVEYDDVAALYIAVGHQQPAEASALACGREDLLVDEQKIADEQGMFHAFRGDEEGLEDKREQEQGDHDGSQQRGRGLRQS